MREIVSLEGFWDFWGPKANNTFNFTWFIQHNTGVCMEGMGTGMGMWDGENGENGRLSTFNQLHSIG